MSDVALKSKFYDFLSRYSDQSFDEYMASSTLDEDYINWHGYCLPYVYTNDETEYAAIRNGCALFDASPVKKYRVRGADAGLFLDGIMTRPMSTLPEMRATYAIWCNEDGMLNDDAILYKFAQDDYLLMVAEVDHDELFDACKGSFDVVVTEETPSMAGMAVQGAKSCAVLKTFGFENIENHKPFEMQNYSLNGHNVMVARVGFTADLGYEIWFAPEACADIEAAFLNAEKELSIQIAGYGLTTIQMCRMEGGMIVPGWDTEQMFENPMAERSPLELGMSWNMDLKREGNFVGKDALLKEKAEGSRFKMTGFEIKTECELEDGAEVFANIDGEAVQVGTLPSVTWSHGFGHWLGLASLQTAHAAISEGYVEIDGEQHAVSFRGLPFVNFERRLAVPAPL